ncbi:MAG: translation initiation factor IF-6 [Candidatus Nanoarchaeia archaeon]|jgi:translation initiation factor 6|nr:translation initiation factor IF-6 [Candidatus Nanoarchaeia archaeon]|tara:strand:- start:414 stop:1097 length:684 start_codon:yes stop_codon:yes gene_type:complete
MVHVDKTNFKGDPNIGLYAVATDSFVLLGEKLNKKQTELLKEVLGVPIITSKIYGTPFAGIFCVANKNTLLVPDIIFDEEFESLKKQLKGIVEVKKFKTVHTALGNTILANDKHAIISDDFSDTQAKNIEAELNVKVKKIKIAESNVPGAYGILTNKGGMFGSITSDPSVKELEKLLKIEVGIGTVSTGSSIVSSGVIANSNGFLVSSNSSGFEIGRIDESLGFIGK